MIEETGIVGKQVCPACYPDTDFAGKDVITVSWCYEHQPTIDGTADKDVPAAIWIGRGEADGHDCREIQRLIT